MIAAPFSLLLLGALQQGGGGGGAIRGMVYDSLLRGPLAGAEVWLRGTERRTATGGDGRFRFDSVPVGRYILAVSHPGLDSAGIFTVASPLSVRTPADTARITIATPSLATLWRRRCGMALGSRPDSGLVFGVVQDAATDDLLAGAALIVSWIRLVQVDNVNVRAETRDTRAGTDSVGGYYACGVAADVTLGVRGYAGTDSTGLIDVRLGARGLARQDLKISLAPSLPATTPRPMAMLRGRVFSSDAKPLFGARAGVREAASTPLQPDGTFLLAGLPAGTQWVTVQAIGRQGTGQAVDLKAGVTASVSMTLEPLPVLLDPLRVTAPRSRQMAEFEERRRSGLGYVRAEAELARIKTMRGVFTGIPTVQLSRARANSDFIVLLPGPSASTRAYCVAALYIDGFRAGYDQLSGYLPSDLVGVEVYVRPTQAPIQYQGVSTGCGVVLVWTKYVEGR